MECNYIVFLILGALSKSYHKMVFSDPKHLSGRVTSDGFELFDTYQKNKYDSYIINSRGKCSKYVRMYECGNWKIELFVDHFKLQESQKCLADYLEIDAMCPGKREFLGRWCGTDIPASFVTFRCDSLRIYFRADGLVETDGFFISFKMSPGFPPPNNLTYQIIKSPLRPANVYKDFFANRVNKEPSNAAASEKPLYMIALYVIMAL